MRYFDNVIRQLQMNSSRETEKMTNRLSINQYFKIKSNIYKPQSIEYKAMMSANQLAQIQNQAQLEKLRLLKQHLIDERKILSESFEATVSQVQLWGEAEIILRQIDIKLDHNKTIFRSEFQTTAQKLALGIWEKQHDKSLNEKIMIIKRIVDPLIQDLKINLPRYNADLCSRQERCNTAIQYFENLKKFVVISKQEMSQIVRKAAEKCQKTRQQNILKNQKSKCYDLELAQKAIEGTNQIVGIQMDVLSSAFN